MQELVGRLITLDPAASETLKVVSYFDALVSAGAGAEALLRSAAALAGTTAGMRVREQVSRRGPDGRRVEGGTRSAVREISVGEVWLERMDAAHANDAMVVERLALALEFR